MNFGIRIEKDNKTYCSNCGTHVGNDGKTQMNFCPRCGSHLNLKSAKLYDERVNSEIISILYQLLDDIKENSGNPEETIEAFIKELADNK
jgi:hypothetical protein